jgi:hypothetical protein
MRGLPHVTVVLWILEIVAVICPGGAPGASGDPVAPERPRLSTSRKSLLQAIFQPTQRESQRLLNTAAVKMAAAAPPTVAPGVASRALKSREITVDLGVSVS